MDRVFPERAGSAGQANKFLPFLENGNARGFVKPQTAPANFSKRSRQNVRATTEQIELGNEVDDILGFKHITDRETNLLVPDGSFTPQLRATIMDALIDTKFDSVPAVLNDNSWMDSTFDLAKNPYGHPGAFFGSRPASPSHGHAAAGGLAVDRGLLKKAPCNFNSKNYTVAEMLMDHATVSPKVDPSRKPLISVLKFNTGASEEERHSTTNSKRATSVNGIPRVQAHQQQHQDRLITAPKDLTMKGVDYPGFSTEYESVTARKLGSRGDKFRPKSAAGEEESELPTQQRETCFACWSAGMNLTCAIHEDKTLGKAAKKAQSLLLCRNWSLSVMRRRRRAEEIQEVFNVKGTSLRYDVKRKTFSTVTELHHPIYRRLFALLNRFNSFLFVYLKVKRWLLTLPGHVRTDKRNFCIPKRAEARDQILTMSRHLHSTFHQKVVSYTFRVRKLLPVAPTTGYSWPERIGQVQYLFKHYDPAIARDVELILVYPTPVSQHLFNLRPCSLPVPRAIPMPSPDYSNDNAAKIQTSNRFIDDMCPAAWLERLVTSVARDCCEAAYEQIRIITPPSGLELLESIKQPIPSTIKFATIGRKPKPGNLDIIALPMELLLNQLISTFVPAQYGSFVLMEKASTSPMISSELLLLFKSLLMVPLKQLYIHRPLEHPLNYRRSPTIGIKSSIGIDDIHAYGTNRPDQTGERESHGFRTSTWSVPLVVDDVTDPLSFMPNADIVTPSRPFANVPHRTYVDLSYPFCQPSSRDNTTLDFYHLLLTGRSSGSKTQVFTALSMQEPGRFLIDCDLTLPTGRLVVNVYRSWAFTQRDPIQEFKTDDGVPYWYVRATGQTFWERPLFPEERVSPLAGGVDVDYVHSEEPTTVQRGDEGLSRHHTQGEFRKLMTSHHETPVEATRRRTYAARSAQTAFYSGALPPREEGTEAVPTSATALTLTQSTSATTAFAASAPHITPEADRSEFVTEDPSLLPALAASAASSTTRIDQVQSPALLSGSSSHPLITSAGPTTTISMPALQGAHGGGIMDPHAIANFSQSIGHLIAGMIPEKASAQDMIQLGMGMGMAILQSGLLQQPQDQVSNNIRSPSRSVHFVPSSAHNGETGTGAGEAASSSSSSDVTLSLTHQQRPGSSSAKEQQLMFPQVSEEVALGSAPSAAVAFSNTNGQPIGQPYATKTLFPNSLDHSASLRRAQELSLKSSEELSAMDKARQLEVHKMTITPDIAPPKELTVPIPLNADEEVRKAFPVVAYPELSSMPMKGDLPPDYVTHAVALAGASSKHASITDDSKMAEHHHNLTSATRNPLRAMVVPIPENFFEAIVAKRVASEDVDYIPRVPNLPKARTVGRVKPRSAALDWLAVSFDPWSGGKKPLNSEFIESLESKAKRLVTPVLGSATVSLEDSRKAMGISDAVITIEDAQGLSVINVEREKARLVAAEFDKLCSLVRHGKFNEAAEMMDRYDWNVPIDYKNENGNTMLHVACQNGSKRLVKLCLRRGADINVINLNGQSPLHYALGYGFDELGQYLMKKGADDKILNKDGLTCYEGLGLRELEHL